MPRAAIIAAACVLLAGCATKEQQEAAVNAWGDCVMVAVKRMDDGKTDPMSMAYGIAPMCAHLYNEVRDTMVSGMITDNGQAHMRSLVNRTELRMITSAILIHRRGQSKP